MRRFANRVEKILVRIIVLGLVLMVVVQGLMTSDSLRLYLSWGERMEGQSLEYPASSINNENEDAGTVQSPYATLTIAIDKFSSLPEAFIMINGAKTASFDKRELKIKVMAGDKVEIDSKAYDLPVDYRIIDVSNNLAYPAKGEVYRADGGIVMVGKIIVK